MKKSFLFFAALAAILSLSSCKKDFTATPESGQNETSRQPARITVSVQGAPVTKADIATRNNEDRLNTVEVYVFELHDGAWVDRFDAVPDSYNLLSFRDMRVC